MKDHERERLFKQVFFENRDRIYRLCYGFAYHRDDAEDLFQEVMINVWSHLHTFREEASINTWVFRISVNTALLYRRKVKRRKRIFSGLSSEDVPPPVSPDYDRPERSLEVEQLRKKIAALQPQDRLMITLLLEGLSYQDISEIVGISANYVGVKINRIKRALYRQLGGPDE